MPFLVDHRRGRAAGGRRPVRGGRRDARRRPLDDVPPGHAAADRARRGWPARCCAGPGRWASSARRSPSPATSRARPRPCRSRSTSRWRPTRTRPSRCQPGAARRLASSILVAAARPLARPRPDGAGMSAVDARRCVVARADASQLRRRAVAVARRRGARACSGPNGAGKSTLLRALAGLVPLDRRARSALGRRVWTTPPPAARAAGARAGRAWSSRTTCSSRT